MAKIPTKHIDGDAAVGRHVAVGGDATVQGSMRVGHNVRIDGWLEAPNIKGPNKGLFKTDAKLKELYPTPQDGWWALVGDTVPAQVYIASGGSWHAQENEDGSPKMSGAPDVEPTELLEAVHQALDEMDELKLDVEANSKDIDGLDETQKEHGESIEKLGTDVQTAQTTADKATEAAAKAQPRWVDFDALDYMGTDLTGLIEATTKTDHTRWRVTTPLGDGRLTIGVLELLSTPGQCAVTQVLTTNCLIDDKGVLSKGHTDDKIRVLYRTFSVMSGSMGDDARLKWTPWKPLEPESLAKIRGDLKGLREDLDHYADILQTVDHSLSDTKNDVKALQAGVNDNMCRLNDVEGDMAVIWPRVDSLEKSVGSPGGIAPLGSNGLIPAQYIPGAMDDVKYFDGIAPAVVLTGMTSTELSSTSDGCRVMATHDLTSFWLCHKWTDSDGTEQTEYFTHWADSGLWVQPVRLTGGLIKMEPIPDKTYIDKDAAQCYLWGGSKLVSTDKQLALGHTERTAFPGNEGERLQHATEDNTRRIVTLEQNKLEPMTDAEIDAMIDEA